ncbi:MAG: preprotein translocase subunit SecG [Aureliella sp.]
MLLVAVFSQYFFGITICITSLFLMMLVLVQRGRGGGLTGALGGAGGQSAFGTKAGDLFTRITVGVAAVWIALCAAAVFFLKDRALPDTGVTNRDTATIESTLEPGGAAAVSPPASSNSLSTSSARIPAATSPAVTSPAVTGPAVTSPAVDDTPASSEPAGIALPERAPETDDTTPSDSPATEPPSVEQGEPTAATTEN